MQTREPIALKRACEAVLVPAGTRIFLQAGDLVEVVQVLGGNYTVVVDRQLARIDAEDADALGLEPGEDLKKPPDSGFSEQAVWDLLKTCYDPEIPVNIVDLGLIYDCQITPLSEGDYRVDVKMTLTAPGCGMGQILADDVKRKIEAVSGVREVNVEIVWDPSWNQEMMSEEARLQLGFL